MIIEYLPYCNRIQDLRFPTYAGPDEQRRDSLISFIEEAR
jgi:hypothetical protein